MNENNDQPVPGNEDLEEGHYLHDPEDPTILLSDSLMQDERHIDWDKVKAFTELKAVMMGMGIRIWEDPEKPNPQFDCMRHLFKPVDDS